MSIEQACLYVVATPIGNLEDLSPRAQQVLESVDLILAEDTRHSQRLLQHFGIRTICRSLHEHNEQQQVPGLIDRLKGGQTLALISDAGTPLISDPGYRLVKAAREAGLRVAPIPGASALIAALSVSGLPSDRFFFEGFLPARASARQERLTALADFSHTLIFYESSHRIKASLGDMASCFGSQRRAVVARELTKTFEQIQDGSLADLCLWLAADSDHQRGEFVVMVAGQERSEHGADEAEARRVLGLCLQQLPVKTAARLTAEITGLSRNQLYQWALQEKP